MARNGPTVNGTKDDNKITTIQPGPMLSDDGASEIFDAFREVNLDLTFSFSRQNSPVPSTTELQPLEFASQLLSPPVCLPSSSTKAETTSSFHNLSRTTSFASQLTPLSPLMKTKKKFKSAKFSSDQSSILRGSWPANKFVGRGTPVDRSRRREWGGLSTDNVAEDGLLFSDVRATSLDSRSPRISTSSEWDFLNAVLPTSGSSLSGGCSFSIHHPLEEDAEEEEEDRIPPLQKIDIKLESETENWASVVETVLSCAEKGTEEPISAALLEEAVPDSGETNVTEDIVAGEKEQASPEVLERMKSELQFDLNIDKALDLGFSPAVSGGTLFTLAAITDSDNSNLTIRRTTTTSTQSQYSTPSEGPSDDRPTTLLTPGSMTPVQDSTKVFSDIKSTISTTRRVVARGGLNLKLSSKTTEGMPWWKKAIGKLKRVQVLLRPHQSTC